MGGGGGSAAGGCISAAAGQMRSQQPSSQAQAQTGLMTPAMAAQPSYRAQPPARLRSVSDYAGDGGPRAVTPTDSPGLAPSGMAPSRTLLGTAPPLSHGSSRQAVLPEGRGVAPGDDALTWTSALGVSDVRAPLRRECRSRRPRCCPPSRLIALQILREHPVCHMCNNMCNKEYRKREQ